MFTLQQCYRWLMRFVISSICNKKEGKFLHIFLHTKPKNEAYDLSLYFLIVNKTMTKTKIHNKLILNYIINIISACLPKLACQICFSAADALFSPGSVIFAKINTYKIRAPRYFLKSWTVLNPYTTFKSSGWLTKLCGGWEYWEMNHYIVVF